MVLTEAFKLLSPQTNVYKPIRQVFERFSADLELCKQIIDR